MTKLIGVFGKKQSGKGTVSSYIAGLALYSRRQILSFKILNNCNFIINGQEVNPNNINPKIAKIYSFADTLKEICVDVLDVSPNNVFGTDEEKSQLTHLHWKNFPGVITDEKDYKSLQRWYKRRQLSMGKKNLREFPFIYRPYNYITGRELLQFLGTEFFRNIYSDCWVSALRKKISKDYPEFAIIADARFKNELEFIKTNNGYSFYLTRHIHKDSHASENDLDENSGFTKVINNENGNLKELYRDVLTELRELGVLKP